MLKNIFKNWVWNWKWVQYSVNVAMEEARKEERLTAFKYAHDDIMETMADDTNKKAEELAKTKLEALLSPIDASLIVKLDKPKGIVYIGTEPADDARLSNLKAEAEFLTQSDLWKILNETPKELAQKAMFVEGDNLDTMKKGRSMLFTLSTQQNIVDLFKGYVKK